MIPYIPTQPWTIDGHAKKVDELLTIVIHSFRYMHTYSDQIIKKKHHLTPNNTVNFPKPFPNSSPDRMRAMLLRFPTFWATASCCCASGAWRQCWGHAWTWTRRWRCVCNGRQPWWWRCWGSSLQVGMGWVSWVGRWLLLIFIYICLLLSLFFFLFDTRRLDEFRLAGGWLSILVSPINFLSAIHHPTISAIVYSVLHPTYCKFYLNGRQRNFSKSGFVHVWGY